MVGAIPHPVQADCLSLAPLLVVVVLVAESLSALEEFVRTAPVIIVVSTDATPAMAQSDRHVSLDFCLLRSPCFKTLENRTVRELTSDVDQDFICIEKQGYNRRGNYGGEHAQGNHDQKQKRV